MQEKYRTGRSPRVLVIGSSNTDMVVRTPRLPGPGETLTGGTFFMNAGGKGANQAVAAARLGADVTLVCKTGDDVFGAQALESFRKEGIRTDYVFRDPGAASGVALITVDHAGENCIVVAPGANARLLPEDLTDLGPVIEACDVVILQLEIPLDTVLHAAREAFVYGKKVILNPAPAIPLPSELLAFVHLIIPNESEAAILSDTDTSDDHGIYTAAGKISDMGVPNVIVTRGSKGALVYSKGVFGTIAAVPVKAVDTTAAGDVFTAAVAVRLAEGASLPDAARFATNAAAISVTREGAQTSAPYRNEVTQTININL